MPHEYLVPYPLNPYHTHTLNASVFKIVNKLVELFLSHKIYPGRSKEMSRNSFYHNPLLKIKRVSMSESRYSKDNSINLSTQLTWGANWSGVHGHEI